MGISGISPPAAVGNPDGFIYQFGFSAESAARHR